MGMNFSAQRLRCAALLALTVIGLCSTVERAAAAPTSEPDKPLLVGFLPAFNAERILGTFEPLLDYVAEKTGTRMRLETAPDMPEYMRRVVQEQRYAFTFMPPHLYLNAEKVGYRAIAKITGTDLRAVFVTRNESPINTFSDLKGKQLAVMDDVALVTVLGLAKLRAVGLVPRQDVALIEVSNMDSCIQAVLRGRTDAAVVVEPFFKERLPADVRGQMRVFMTSDSVPHMPVSVAPWVDAELRDRVLAVLLGMSDDKEGAALLRRIAWQGFVQAQPGDYASLEKLMSAPQQP